MKGVTLIELIIAISLSSVVGMLLLVIIVNSAGLFYHESSKLSEGLNINDALSKIRSTIKQSNIVAASYASGSTTYTSGSTQLVLKVASIDSTNNLISNVYDFFVFYLNQKELRFKVFPDAASFRKVQDQIFSSSVDSLNFQYFDLSSPPKTVAPNLANKVRISLTLKQKNGADFVTNTATSEANLRND